MLEILGHLADVEIVYGYRLRQMLADNKPIIAPLDQNAWARNLNYLDSPPSELVAFYELARHSQLAFAANFEGVRPFQVGLPPRNPTRRDRRRPSRENGWAWCYSPAAD